VSVHFPLCSGRRMYLLRSRHPSLGILNVWGRECLRTICLELKPSVGLQNRKLLSSTSNSEGSNSSICCISSSSSSMMKRLEWCLERVLLAILLLSRLWLQGCLGNGATQKRVDFLQHKMPSDLRAFPLVLHVAIDSFFCFFSALLFITSIFCFTSDFQSFYSTFFLLKHVKRLQ